METTPIAIVDPNKPSPSPSPSPSGKVCTVSFLSTLGDYYAILIVDLASSPSVVDGGGYISTAPTFLIDRTHLNNEYYAFCVLDSTLFIFQRGLPGVFGPREGKSVYSVDLNPSEFKFISAETHPVLDKSMIKPLPDLLWPKYCTEAVPTPDAKRIIVFSRLIYYNQPDPIDFELYGTDNSKRRTLPSPEIYCPYEMFGGNQFEYSIYSFTFITDSVFLIQTSKFGIFTIDIDADNPSWQKMDSFVGSVTIPSFHKRFYVLADHKLCIAGFKAYNISQEYADVFDCCNSSKFPKTSFADDFEHGGRLFTENHIVYGEDGKLFGSVFFQMGISRYTNYAHIRLDVYRFDMVKFKKDVQKSGKGARLEFSVFKTFKFVFEGYHCSDLVPGCCYPIVT